MKIFSPAQIYKADDFTTKSQNISSDALMERAAEQIFNWLHHRLKGSKVKIHLFCGIGNNGGDGIALARLLLENEYNISVFVVNYSEKRSDDFLLNLGRLKERKLWPIYLDASSELPQVHPQDIIVDAIFGIGLNRNPADWVVGLIKHLNSLEAFTLSVDIPSGLFMGRVPKIPEAVVKADYVLSFQLPKLVFFLPQTAGYVQNWEVLDIGLDSSFINSQPTDFEFISKFEALPMYKPRSKFSYKGTYGHALVVGGSYGKVGAVQLASRACLVAGAGLVSSYVPECGYIPLQTALPEVMVITNGTKHIEAIVCNLETSAIAIGMGLGIQNETIKAVGKFLKTNKSPLVIDADAINILSTHREFLELLPAKSILTPHLGELKRLLGNWKDDFDKLEKAKVFSKEYDLILVLKGAHTITLYKDMGYINSTGNPGMATAGSGDALAGIICGLVSQGYPNLNAAIFGVYLHGLAGDIAASKYGFEAITAMRIIDDLGNAFKELFRRPEDQKTTD